MNTTLRAVLGTPALLFALLTALGCQLKYVMTFESDTYQVQAGDPVTLQWSINTRDDVELVSVEIAPDIGEVSPEGTLTLTPTEDTRYKLTATFIDQDGKALQDERFVGITVAQNQDKEFCFCDDDKGVNREVINHNNPNRSLGHKTLEVLRVTMPGKETHSMSSIQRATRRFVNSQEQLSRGRLTYNYRDSRTVNTDTTVCKTAKNAAERARRKGTFVTIITIPCGPQHASISKSKVHIKQNIQMIRHHEVGHVLRLNHSGTWDRANNDVIGYGDGSSNMSRYGARAYTASQLHGLGWTDPHDTVRIDDYLDQAGYYEGKLRPVNKNEPGTLPMALVAELAHNDRRIWISAPYNDRLQLYVHSQRTCIGCGGMFMGTRRLGIIKDTGITMQVAGLNVTFLDAQKNKDGIFTEFTVRVEPAPTPFIVKWDFEEKAGTNMQKLASSGIITPGPWNRSISGNVKTNGTGQLAIRPKYTSAKKNSTWFSLAASGNELNRGKAWVGTTIDSFHFSGSPNERLHLGLTQDHKKSDRKNELIAELQLIRVGRDQIHLAAYHGAGGQPESGTPVHNSDDFAGQMELVLELDFDQGTYQGFYRISGDTGWYAVNEPTSLPKDALKAGVSTSLRLQPLGSYTDDGNEQILLDSLYVSTQSPMQTGGVSMMSFAQAMPAPNSDDPALPLLDETGAPEDNDHDEDNCDHTDQESL